MAVSARETFGGRPEPAEGDSQVWGERILKIAEMITRVRTEVNGVGGEVERLKGEFWDAFLDLESAFNMGDMPGGQSRMSALVRSGEVRGLLAEAVVYQLLDEVSGENSDLWVKVGDLLADRRGIDFVVGKGQQDVAVDVTTATSEEVLLEKLAKPVNYTLLVPLRYGGLVNDKQVGRTWSLVSEVVEGVDDIWGLAEAKLGGLVGINEAVLMSLRDRGLISEGGYREQVEFVRWLGGN